MTIASVKPVRVLLVYPPSRSQLHESCPTGLTMVGAALEQAGFEVRLLDANAARRPQTSEQITRFASQWKPQVIGMTLVTPLVLESYRLAAMLRQTGALLLAGGPHATILPDEPLSHGFDAVVIGEGEPAAVEAVKALVGLMPKHEVKGWAYLGPDGTVCRTDDRPREPDLDSLPIPARHLVDPADYGESAGGALHQNLFTSRGCPAKCAYCAGALFGKRFRPRSADSVLREMKEVHEAYGTTHFHFMDDAMTADKSRMEAFCRGLVDIALKVTWSMMTRIDLVNEELLAMFAQAGCVRIDYGVESGCPETLKRIHKPHTVQMVRKIIPATARVGIRPYVFFILGFPWEGHEQLEATERLMAELSPYVDCFHPAVASIIIPFPGTEIYERYKDEHGFQNWWLSPERTYDSPARGRHSFFERRVFTRGAVLDADFFHYHASIKTRIRQVFKFMYMHNLRNAGRLSRWAHALMLDVSESLQRSFPALERLLFTPLVLAERVVARR